ncbi:MAG: leucine-rich repeat protein [Muribaculaceae bacterium]|nr:leucine-rich repeat protein [Muribaculaceae bacterium]
MRKLFLLMLATAITAINGFGLTVTNNAGQLADALQNNLGITALTVTGTMDARDFLFITNELNELTTLDLTGVTIVPFNNNGAALYGTVANYLGNEIPRTAFFGKKLTSVTLPSTLESIGFAAFAGCDRLQSVTLPASLTYIDDYAFAGTGLTSITIPATVQDMGKGVFARCEALQSAVLDCRYVGDFAFLGDISLNNVQVGPNVSSILRAVFSGCSALTTVNFDPACRLTRIDDEAFINSGLENIDINSLNLGTIGDWAFAQTRLSSIVLANGMTSMGEGALAHNPLLTTVTFPGMGHDRAGGRMAPTHNHTLAAVSDYAFADDSLLNAGAMLPKGVNAIGNYALYNVSAVIDTMRLPSTVTSLGDMAMAGMIGMQVLKTDATEVPAVGNEVWAGVNQPEIPLIAPDNTSLKAYQEADQWMYFFFGIDVLLGDVNGDGAVSIADVTALIDYLLEGGDINEAGADVTQDGNISIADVTALIDKLLGGNSGKSLNTIQNIVKESYNSTSDCLVVPAMTLRPGETRTFEVALNNVEHNYTALQCELVLPQGVTLKSIKGIGRGYEHNYSFVENKIEDNVYSMIGASSALHSFVGNEGNILSITVTADDEFSSQDAELVFTNVVLVTPKHEGYFAADAKAPVSEGSGIEQVTTSKEVANVRYINVAGQESETPFSGVNIVVTTYTDGTTSTVKVMK